MTPVGVVAAPSGLANVLESGGPSLALAGMTIVFLALISISLFIAALPRVLAFWDSLRPERPVRQIAEARVEVAHKAAAPDENARVALMASAILLHDPAVAALLGFTTKPMRTPEN